MAASLVRIRVFRSIINPRRIPPIWPVLASIGASFCVTPY